MRVKQTKRVSVSLLPMPAAPRNCIHCHHWSLLWLVEWPSYTHGIDWTSGCQVSEILSFSLAKSKQNAQALKGSPNWLIVAPACRSLLFQDIERIIWIIWSHEFTWYHFVDWCSIDCKHLKRMPRNPSKVSCWPTLNVSLMLDVSHQWPTWPRTKSSSRSNWGTPEWHTAPHKVPVCRFGLVWTVCRFDEMLMPRSSVRSMRTTSPHISGRSSEKLVKTQQQGLPGRNSAICRSVSVAFKCRGPLDMRRLPCHGPGLRKAHANWGIAANLCPITIN